MAFAQCGPAVLVTWIAFILAYLALKNFGEVEKISIKLDLLALPLIWICFGSYLLLSIEDGESRIPTIAFGDATGDLLRFAFYSITGSVLVFILSKIFGKRKSHSS